MVLKKAVLVGSLCGACLLGAEESGLYVQGGFQYSNFAGRTSTDKTAIVMPDGSLPGANTLGLQTVENDKLLPYGMPTAMNGNLFGVDIQFGYRQFFGQKKHFGLRYYGIFSGQGGEFSGISSGFVNQPASNLFYGAGLDALFNFYEKNERTLGVFAGVMIGGSSWIMGKATGNASCRWPAYSRASKIINHSCGTTMDKSWSSLAYYINNPKADAGASAKFSPTFVQFIVNMGFRTNLSKHQGFEFGVRVPTIDTPYFTITNTRRLNALIGGGKNSKATLTFRRNVALYWNYVYNF
ncbi:outer membrane protein [Helicobacter felis]|uniref:OMP643 n=2 Tax=Helicobacter felis TaxID=214 RepID=A0A1M4NGB0_HELFE|nr:outer membrane protein [Helicobacter felis]SFZ71150.1 OMP643 [Helicobacter felis]